MKEDSTSKTHRHQMPINLPQQLFILFFSQLENLSIEPLERLHCCVGIVGFFCRILVEIITRQLWLNGYILLDGHRLVWLIC
jgi:hypothetical protein